MIDNNIIEEALNMVEQIPEINIYLILQTHFKNPLYAKRKERDYKHKFDMTEILTQADSDVNYKVVGDYKYVLTPYCLMNDSGDETYPILIKAKDGIVEEIFYFVDKQKYVIKKG